MLEKLFGSRTRLKLLRHFLSHPKDEFFVRELARQIEEQINSVRRELGNLETMGLLHSRTEDKKKFYRVNKEFPLLHELQALVLKSRLNSEHEFISSIRGLGTVDYFILTGHFVNDGGSDIDMLIVGTVNKTRLQKLLEQFRDQFGKQLRYTLMPKEEFDYRQEVADRFIFSVLNGKKIVVVDRVNNVRV